MMMKSNGHRNTLNYQVIPSANFYSRLIHQHSISLCSYAIKANHKNASSIVQNIGLDVRIITSFSTTAFDDETRPSKEVSTSSKYEHEIDDFR